MPSSLSGEQFKRVKHGDTTIYAVQDPGHSTGPYGVPTAEVQVYTPEDEYHYNQDAVARGHSLGSGWPVAPSVEAHGQTPLFSVEHTPPTVDWMASHKDLRHHIPALMGIAANDTRSRFGEIPSADSDLSVYSSRLVDRLAAKGVIAPRDQSRPLNSFSTKHPSTNEYTSFDYQGVHTAEVSAHEVARGSHTIRTALRGPGKPSSVAPLSGAQFKARAKQVPLFGREK
jgi:hypothetical protein